MYTTKKLKCDKTPDLDMLAHESGRCYCKVVSLLWKVKRKKGFWLSQGAVQKYMRLHGVAIERNRQTETITVIIVAFSITETALVQSTSGTKYRDSC